MSHLRKTLTLSGLAFLAGVGTLTAAPAAKLVTPGAMPEAVALLETLQAISGRYTLTGQHNYPATADRNSEFARKYTGKMPAVWTSDFGFAAEGDTDSYLARPIVVAEAIRQHRLGALVSLCWHAVPPTADEPVTFRPPPGSDPARLNSVQGQLRDEQFKDVLTPGTALHTQWLAQVDAIAVFLRQLQEARAPVLWRPYHEMNSDWFWWGGRTEGAYTTAALYRQIFDRLVNHHQLKNLVWEWSVDRVGKPGMEHEKYFPGIEFVDVLTLDVYGNDFAQSYYDSLVKLSQGKPLALAEVGNPPAPAVLAQQPLWTYYATWAGMVRNTTRKQYAALMQDPRVLNLSDPAYAGIVAAFRQACGLPAVKIELPPVNFSGTWVLNEELSQFGRRGPGSTPVKLVVEHHENGLTVQSTLISEFAADEVTELKIPLDGTEVKSTFMKFPRTTSVRPGQDRVSLVLESATEFPSGPPGSKVKAVDTWTLLELGNRLSIHHTAPSFQGPGQTEQTFVYDRR